MNPENQLPRVTDPETGYLNRRDFLRKSAEWGARLGAATLLPDYIGSFPVIPNHDSRVESHPLKGLDTQLADIIHRYPFKTRISVVNLQTGEIIGVNGQQEFQTGCVINWFALLSVCRDLQEGRYKLSEVDQTIANTIRNSDAYLGRELIRKTGGGDVIRGLKKVNNLIGEMGLDDTFLDHPPAYPSQSLKGLPNTTTTHDLVKGLGQFWYRGVLNNRWTEYLFEKMKGVKPGLNFMIPAGVTYGDVGHKNGYFWKSGGWIQNDAGIVHRYRSSGNQYAYGIAMSIENVPTEFDGRMQSEARQLSAATWQKFNQIH